METNLEIAITICIICLNVNMEFPNNIGELLRMIYINSDEYEYGTFSEDRARAILVLINQQREDLKSLLEEKRLNL